jgi:hypothetical protein
MINVIRETDTAPRLRERPRRTARSFSRWYDQNHANDQDNKTLSEKVVVKPHSLTSMEDLLFLASQETMTETSAKPKANPYQKGLFSSHMPEDETKHQYVFEFMRMPLNSKPSFKQE